MTELTVYSNQEGNELKPCNTERLLKIVEEDFNEQNFAEFSYAISQYSYKVDTNKKLSYISFQHSYRHPSLVESTQELKLYNGSYLSGIGIFSIKQVGELSTDFKLNIIKRLVEEDIGKGRAAYIIAFHKNDASWGIALVRVEKFFGMGNFFNVLVSFANPKFLLSAKEKGMHISEILSEWHEFNIKTKFRVNCM